MVRFNIRNFIGVLALSLAGWASPLSSDASASGLQTATANGTGAHENRQPAVVAVSYSAPAYSYMSYAGSAEDVTAADKPSVSAVPEVDSWTVLLAIAGLVGMRLLHGGKKRPPAIN